MGLPSIVLDPAEASTWIETLRANGFTIEVDSEEMDRYDPSPRVRETPYTIRLRQEWLRVLLSQRQDDSRTFLTFATHQKGCSPSLRFEVLKRLKATHHERLE